MDRTGAFTWDRTVEGEVRHEVGILHLDETHATFLVTDPEGTRIEEVRPYVWASDGERLTLAAAAGTRWHVFAYERAAP